MIYVTIFGICLYDRFVNMTNMCVSAYSVPYNGRYSRKKTVETIHPPQPKTSLPARHISRLLPGPSRRSQDLMAPDHCEGSRTLAADCLTSVPGHWTPIELHLLTIPPPSSRGQSLSHHHYEHLPYQQLNSLRSTYTG